VLAVLALLLVRWRFLEPWIAQLGSLTSVRGISFGLPAVYLVLESQQRGTVSTIPPFADMLVTFIGIAAILPDLLYYLFERQRLYERREGFLRDIGLLDPNLETLDDAETFYGPILTQVLGSSQERDFLGGLQLRLLVSTVLIVMGRSITLLPTYLYQWPLPPGSACSACFARTPSRSRLAFWACISSRLTWFSAATCAPTWGPKPTATSWPASSSPPTWFGWCKRPPVSSTSTFR
jgi:hypothetical protein